jgi:hypothetical protein
MLVGEFLRISDAKNSSLIIPGVLQISLMASMCCKSHEDSFSFMASDRERKNFFFQSTDARRLVLEHFGLKTQHLAADDFLPAIFVFFK